LLTALFGLGCITTTPDEDFALIVLNDMGRYRIAENV